MLNPLSPGPGILPERRRLSRRGSRQSPPSNSGGGVGCADKSGCGEYATASCFVPPQPPGGGLQPPRPLPGGAEGGASRSRQATARPAARLVGRSASPRPSPARRILAAGPAAVLAAAWSARRPPVGSRGPPPPSPYHAPLMRPIRIVRSHVVFRHHIPHFLGENGRFAGFWGSTALVYFGTITDTGPDCPARKKQWPRGCWYHPRGLVRKLSWSKRPMATVADAARPVGAAPPPVRHGICRLTIRIHNTEYRLRPCPPEAGILAAWSLRKIGTDRPARYIVTAPKGMPARCTCPDHERSGWTCKHLGALTAAGLIPGPKPPKARTDLPGPRPPDSRQECPPSHRPGAGHRRIRPVSLPADHLPEGWQPGGATRPSPRLPPGGLRPRRPHRPRRLRNLRWVRPGIRHPDQRRSRISANHALPKEVMHEHVITQSCQGRSPPAE